jgi:hypothetical protein
MKYGLAKRKYNVWRKAGYHIEKMAKIENCRESETGV